MKLGDKIVVVLPNGMDDLNKEFDADDEEPPEMEPSKRLRRVTKEDTIQMLDYWIGIEECNCFSTLPTGGCHKCDLERIRQYVLETIPVMRELEQR